MSLAVVHSRALTSGTAAAVTVEVHLSNGLPLFSIVGLPDTEVRESRERVRAALQNCRFDFPARRITVNLAPADLPKDSGRFDLPIAVGILVASGQLRQQAIAGREFAGELSLSGELRPMRSAFAIACGVAGDAQPGSPPPQLFLPAPNAPEAALVPGIEAFGVRDLLSLCQELASEAAPAACAETACGLMPARPLALPGAEPIPEMSDVVGQLAAKRALEIAAAGGLHLLMVGPPGAGKSMLAARLAPILPPMSEQEALESAALLSANCEAFSLAQWGRRPFRAPHHNASAAALVGGGNPPRPGEITLAHHGVLFLDELPEFDRRVLEALREPLEAGIVSVARAGRHAIFPAGCQFVAAMNPCPCGWLGDPRGRCRCSSQMTARYRQKLSGPLLDRIDLQIEVPALASHELAEGMPDNAETSAAIAARVASARQRQLERQGCANRLLSSPLIRQHCALAKEGRALLEKASEKFGWSSRSHVRVLRIARTIADLEARDSIETRDVAEAIQYRRFH